MSSEFLATPPIPYNTHIDNFFGVLCLFSFVFGTLGNILALFYFLTKKRDVPTIIYTSVVLVDLIIAVLTLPVAMSIFDDRSPRTFFQVQVLCDAWGFAWTTMARMSVFLVGLLSVSRAYSLTFPFRPVSKRVIVAIIVVGGVMHSLAGSIPLWFRSEHSYHRAIAACLDFGRDNMPEEAVQTTKVFDYLGILIPVPVIIISFVVTILQLSKRSTANAGRGDQCKQNISVTIALFTGTYLFFNVPAAVVILLYNFTPVIAWPAYAYLIAYIYVMVIPLNAACNPIIYVWRMERLRERGLTVIRMSGRGRGRQNGFPDPVTNQSYVAGTRISDEKLGSAAL